MYKIFINGTPLFLLNNPIPSLPQRKDILQVTYKNTAELKDIISFVEQNAASLTEVYLWGDSLTQVQTDFARNYELIDAAGGVVYNPNGEILLIYRKGRWDLPKGKVEIREPLETAALREVAEETGLTEVVVQRPIVIADNHANITFHTYHDPKKMRILKTTYWYEMHCTNNCRNITPQQEEGITALEWVAPQQLQSGYLQNTYPSIRDVLASATANH
ncbi:NUDIX domain-containing protein [Sphingobacteriales bacterium UPWRP_1]|nr:hypothetical protein BVG80_01915 [Sphingobacteriales bacterium TSM_CSM]PSJ75115.1 NUDIX domain-containing protein [Sphingobacteriales bacterium UPWRP_1]